MIEKVFGDIDNENIVNVTFNFTGRHIYWFLYYIVNDTPSLKQLNNYLLNYNDETLISFTNYLTEINHINKHNILVASECLITGKPFTYNITCLLDRITKELTWMNDLELKQAGHEFICPIQSLENNS